MLFIQWLSLLTERRVKSALIGGLLSWCAILSVAHAQPVAHTTRKDSLVTNLERQLQQATQDTARVALIGEIAVRYNQLGNSRQALLHFQKGLALAQKTNNPISLGRIYSQLGYYHERQFIYASSEVAYQKAILLLKQTHQVSEASRAMYSLARLYTSHGYFLQAINQITANLAYADQTKYCRDVVAAYALLHNLHISLNDRVSAFADLKAMVKTAYQYRNPEDICLAHGNVAEWYEQQDDYKKSLHEWKLALRIGLQLRNSPALMGEICCGIAINLIKQNRLREAETFVSKAFHYFTTDKQLAVDSAWIVLARLRERQNRLKEAYLLITLGLKHARGNNPSWTISILETLYRIQKKQGKYRQALATYQEIRALADSVQEVRKVRMIATIESKLAVERQKKDIAILKKNAVIAKLDLGRTQEQQIRYISFMVGLILVIALACGFAWQTRRKNRMLEQQQNEIMTQAEHLQELNTVKDRLFMMIGHDLRSPVMNLKNNLTKLTAEPLSPERLTAQTDQLKRTIDTLYTTLDNLLHWAALQGNGVLTRQRFVELAPLVTEALALLEPAIAHKQLRLTVQADDVVGWTDEYQAQIVIRNVVHNAIKFTPPEGQVTIYFEQSDEEAAIVIVDTGVGMTTTDPLQAASVSNRQGTLGETGTGLGLQICHELMKRNNGRLVIESKTGQGTTVRLLFPAKENLLID